MRQLGNSKTTEALNPKTRGLDRMGTTQILRALNAEDATVAAAVRKGLPALARAVDAARQRWLSGGRILYLGAGTSGRQALDAMDRRTWRAVKRLGFSDAQIAYLMDSTEGHVRARRLALGVRATFKTVDTCGAEFEAQTPYHYATYEDEDEVRPSTRRRVVILVSGSLSTHDIVAQQTTRGLGGVLPNWNIIQLAFVPFVIYMLAATAEINRPPFDLVEADSELVGGFNTEYSAIGFALFYLAEYMNTITQSAIIVTLFLGGPSGPWNPTTPGLRWLMPIVYFVVKVFIFLFAYVWIRASVPRLRYDQLMDLGWKVMIPISLFWLLVIAAVKVGRWTYVAGAVAAGVIVFALLSRALAVGKARLADERGAAARPSGGS